MDAGRILSPITSMALPYCLIQWYVFQILCRELCRSGWFKTLYALPVRRTRIRVGECLCEKKVTRQFIPGTPGGAIIYFSACSIIADQVIHCTN